MGKDFYSLLCKSKCTALSFSFVRALLYAQTSLSGDDDDTVRRACAFCVLYISSALLLFKRIIITLKEPNRFTAFFNNKSVVALFFSRNEF
jgi:hypothetical protein